MQEIIVIIIGIVVFGIVAWKLYGLFKKESSNINRCASCNTDCALRNMKPEDCDNKN